MQYIVVGNVVYFTHVFHSQSATSHVRPPAVRRGRPTDDRSLSWVKADC